jgi:hypothetical protein
MDFKKIKKMNKKYCISILLIIFSLNVIAQDTIILPQKPKRPKYENYYENDKGFWNSTDAMCGVSVRLTKIDLPFFCFSSVNGYRFNEFLRIGIGVSIKYYLNNDDVRYSSIPWTFPLYLDVRGNIIPQESRFIVPYWAFDLGQEIRNGMFFSPTLGIRFGENRSSYVLGISYSYNRLKAKNNSDKYRNFIGLRFGYEF